jgi:hypothetical protein
MTRRMEINDALDTAMRILDRNETKEWRKDREARRVL